MRRLFELDRSRRAAIGLILALVALFAVNIFANEALDTVRLDLTERKLFTLSDNTREVLSSIDEPITLRLYFSEELGKRNPDYATYFDRVRALLEQYRSISRGKIRLEFHNPEPFTPAEDRAVAYGMEGIPVNNAGDMGYFGLAGTNSTDKDEVIPFLSPAREVFLEYDLTRLVYALIHPERKVVGVISTLPVHGRFAPPYGTTPRWAVINQINQLFAVRPLPADTREIPPDVDVLMVIHPKGLTDPTLYAIDQFVLRGGRALVFVDPNAETESLTAVSAALSGGTGFNRLLRAWGLSLVDGKIAGDLDAARRVNLPVNGKLEVADYVAWLSLGPDNFDRADVVTGDISRLNLATPGILKPLADAKTEVRPLITTGSRAMAIDATRVRLQPDVVGLFRDFRPENRRLILAARVTGPVESAFPSGPPKEKTKNEAKDTGGPTRGKTHLARSKGPINVIVVADADMLHEEFWADTREFFGQRVLVPYADNASFVINALDNLAGSDALIQLRGRSESSRPFVLVQKLRQDAERRYRAKEKELQARLAETQRKLDKLLRREDAEGGVILSASERAAIDEARRKMVTLRAELRDVQRALREDIERLDGLLKFVNIAAIPLLLGIGTLIATLLIRLKRRKRVLPV